MKIYSTDFLKKTYLKSSRGKLRTSSSELQQSRHFGLTKITDSSPKPSKHPSKFWRITTTIAAEKNERMNGFVEWHAEDESHLLGNVMEAKITDRILAGATQQ